MKKVKVENYKKPNYSTLEMITGKILPAGLVIATMITGVPNPKVQASVIANADYSQNETKNFSALAGQVPVPTIVAEKKPITVLVNQVMVEFDVDPILENGRVLVPLRKIFETLGANVSWNDETQTTTATKGRDVIVIGVNDTKMLKNGEEFALDTAAKIVNGRLLVPVRVIAEGLGCDVSWNEIDNQVVIECKKEYDIPVTAGIAPIVNN